MGGLPRPLRPQWWSLEGIVADAGFARVRSLWPNPEITIVKVVMARAARRTFTI
jgi:hypothetical protein